ncbi:MAG: Gfo/Idh/MocA family oxidoreductase [Promethearchaeota archaeon]|nr:MAG: Gfo/Idh/MocA family oxidoreductase [Candidatus Lokiarchaeota archaeon]
MLRVGIIGTGRIFDLNYLGYFYSPDAEIVAVANTNKNETIEKLNNCNLRTVRVYTDYKKMIDKENLDIVEILTPHHLHLSMAEYAAKAGVPGISVQKPLAHTITDCERMIQICKEEKVKLRSFENFRFYPPYLKAKELINDSIIGEPLNFRINTIEFTGPGWPVNPSSTQWRVQMDKCGGGPYVYDDGIHKFSMALWLMDQERVEKVFSWIDFFSGVIDSPANVFWKYPNKNPDDPPKYGSLEFSMPSNLYYPSNYYACDEFIEISGTKGIMWLNQCTAGGNFLSKTPQFPPIVVYTDGEVKTYGEDLPRDWRYSFINATEHFIEIMKTGKGEPIYNGEQGKNLCIFAKMPYISNQRGETVYWEEITPDNEETGSCDVEAPPDAHGRGNTKFSIRKRRDMKKGIKQGLEYTDFNYCYDD